MHDKHKYEQWCTCSQHIKRILLDTMCSVYIIQWFRFKISSFLYFSMYAKTCKASQLLYSRVFTIFVAIVKYSSSSLIRFKRRKKERKKNAANLWHIEDSDLTTDFINEMNFQYCRASKLNEDDSKTKKISMCHTLTVCQEKLRYLK